MAIGCDSTAVNTGIKGGVVRLLEKSFKKSIQWFICLLHINELPLRHLFGYLDGPTTGPRAFSGTIGKALQTCDKNPVVRFKPTEWRELLRPIDVDDLSTDQNYLYEICLAVTSGQFHDDLAYEYSGNMCHSRWLTLPTVFWPNAFVEHDQEDVTSFRNFTKRNVGISGKKRRLLCKPRKRAYSCD